MKSVHTDIEAVQFDGKVIKRLLQYVKPYQNKIIAAILLTLLTSALGPLRPYLTGLAIDGYIAVKDLNGLLLIVIVIISVLLLQGFIQFGLTYLMQSLGQNILYDIRVSLYKHIQNLSLKFFDKNPVGRLVTRVTNDVEGLNELFSSGLVMIIADFLILGWLIFFMFITDVKLTIYSLSVLPLLLIVTSIFRKRVREVFRKVRANVASMNSYMNEIVTGILTIKLLNIEREKKSDFETLNTTNKELWKKTIKHYAVFFPSIEMISTIAIAILIWYSAESVLSESITMGTLIAFFQYSEMFFRPVRDLSEKYTTLQSAMASSERIFSLLDTHENITEAKNPKRFTGFQKNIKFENLSFEYDENKPVLKNVSFEIKKGEKVAIVGSTGSGKTSLVSLFLRFYDYESGAITVDGVSIKDYSISDYRNHLALVMQDVFLFSRSIKDNLLLGKKNHNLHDLKRVTASIGASGFIEEQENNYDTEVMERGKTFSAGQRQLLSFARAYVTKPDILILDEATSNIDTESEQVINDAVDKLLKNRTSIIIAHRLSTIKKADKIIVLHHGHVAETGTHESLIKKNGVYSKLYSLQFDRNIN